MLVESIHVDEVVDLELQQLYVTVTRAGERVLGLKHDDFTVLDRGERQEIVTLAFGEVPFTAILLIDGSVSMDEPLSAAARRGAKAFAAGMTALDEAKAMLFSHHLIAASPFTADPAVLGAAVASEAPGGTALNDQLYWAVRLLERRNGRRVVVLLSDGRDVHSVLDMAQVREAVRHGQTMIYWVRLILEGQGGAHVQQFPHHRATASASSSCCAGRSRESGGRILTSRDGFGHRDGAGRDPPGAARAVRHWLLPAAAARRRQLAADFRRAPRGGALKVRAAAGLRGLSPLGGVTARRSDRGRVGYGGEASKRRKTRVVLWPPKPKAFDSATRISRSTGVPGV